MAAMLGTSRTWRWKLCPCRYCRRDHRRRPEKWYLKRTARNREERQWRNDEGYQ